MKSLIKNIAPDSTDNEKNDMEVGLLVNLNVMLIFIIIFLTSFIVAMGLFESSNVRTSDSHEQKNDHIFSLYKNISNIK